MRIIVLILLMVSMREQLAAAAGLNDFLGIGRSIANILTDGINDFNNIYKEVSPAPEVDATVDQDGISSDDLFNSLSDIWNSKDVKKNRPINSEAITTTEKIVEKVGEEFGNNSINFEDVNSHWLRMRGIVSNMRSIFKELYVKDFDSKESLDVLNLLDRLMEIGDKINLVKKIENTFDEDLIDFLVHKWSDAKKNIATSVPEVKNLLTVDVKVLFLTIAKGLAKQFGHLFHKQALAHLNEQDFVIETMRSSGFKDTEIYDVFRLLDLPTEELLATSNTFEEEARSLGIFSALSPRDDSYHDSHHGGGYGYKMMTKDPFTILAGLAFATFAAYIIYRLLSTTAAARGLKKRSTQDESIAMDLSDMPDALTKIYTWLEQAESVYGDHEEENGPTMEENFSNSVNNLWRSYKKDQSCISRYICDHLSFNGFRELTSGTSIEQISLLGLAELLGAKRSAQLYDSYVTKLYDGEMLNCSTVSPSCDDVTYESIKKVRHKN